MYLIPLGIFLQDGLPPPAVTSLASPDWSGFIRNLIPVTLGNLTGGAGMVGLIYWIIYRRDRPATGNRQDAQKKTAGGPQGATANLQLPYSGDR
jgi:hypothetical protein